MIWVLEGSVLTGKTICSEGMVYFPSSYLTLRAVCDVGGYPFVQGMGYSQLLVFWVVLSIGKITVGEGRIFVNSPEERQNQVYFKYAR